MGKPTDKLAEYIQRIENDDQTLTAIDLSDAGIGDEGADHLFQVLRAHPIVARNIQTLRLHGNRLTRADVSFLAGLVFLDLYNNQLLSINIANLNLSFLNVAYNDLAILDLSGAPALETLGIVGNQLTMITKLALSRLLDKRSKDILFSIPVAGTIPIPDAFPLLDEEKINAHFAALARSIFTVNIPESLKILIVGLSHGGIPAPVAFNILQYLLEDTPLDILMRHVDMLKNCITDNTNNITGLRQAVALRQWVTVRSPQMVFMATAMLNQGVQKVYHELGARRQLVTHSLSG